MVWGRVRDSVVEIDGFVCPFSGSDVRVRVLGGSDQAMENG